MLFTREVSKAIGKKSTWVTNEKQRRVHQVKTLAAKLDNLSLNPRIYMVEREKRFYTHTPWHMFPCSPLHTSNSLKGENKWAF
jgi:sulfur carrier protein ThiS